MHSLKAPYGKPCIDYYRSRFFADKHPTPISFATPFPQLLLPNLAISILIRQFTTELADSHKGPLQYLRFQARRIAY